MQDDLERVKAAIAEWAKGREHVARVYLFGSRIRGQSWEGHPVTPESDLDVAIALDIPDDTEALSFWIDHATPWLRELIEIAGRVVPWEIKLEFYREHVAPKVFRYVNACNVVIYEAGSIQCN